MAALKEWIDLIKFQKAIWVETTDRGDMPPTTLVFRNGECLCILTANQIDRDQGLKAVHIARHTLKADEIIVAFDAHVKSVNKEDAEDFLENYKRGQMQRECDEEGACELGKMSDCIVCHRIDESLEVDLQILPYNYHGKNGGIPFEWTNFGDLQSANSDNMMDALKEGFSGVVPETLREIMESKSKIDDIPLTQMANAMGLNDPKRQQWHIDRAIFQIFDMEGYIVQAHKQYMGEYPGE